MLLCRWCDPPANYHDSQRRNECFVFKTRIKGNWAHALADTGASKNFMSEDLATFLGLQLHPRKQALNVRLADFSVRRCESFVRAHIQISSLAARMAFVVLPTGVPLVLGMPFFDRFEPRIKWRQRQFIVTDNATSHTLQAD